MRISDSLNQYFRNTVFPMLMRMAKSPVVNLFFFVIFPLQINLTICGVIVFGHYRYECQGYYCIIILFSKMMADFLNFFQIVLWQAYLRPVDLRIEIDQMNPSLQIYGQMFCLMLNLMMVFFCMNFFISFINDAHAIALVSLF